MEAASVPAAPAAADGNGQVQAPAAPAAPLAPAQGQPPAPQEPQAPQTPEQDHAARLQEMEQRAQQAEQQLAELQGQGQPNDLLAALQPVDDLGLTPEELAEFGMGAEQPADPQQEQAQQAELENYIRGLAQEVVNPLLEQRQTEQVQAWQKERPDVTPGSELFNEIVATMEGLAERYGNESVVYDTNLLSMAYTAAKAKLADAGAVPAEQAGSNGATLETGPGQPQAGEDSEAEQYKKALLGSKGGSVF